MGRAGASRRRPSCGPSECWLPKPAEAVGAEAGEAAGAEARVLRLRGRRGRGGRGCGPRRRRGHRPRRRRCRGRRGGRRPGGCAGLIVRGRRPDGWRGRGLGRRCQGQRRRRRPDRRDCRPGHRCVGRLGGHPRRGRRSGRSSRGAVRRGGRYRRSNRNRRSRRGSRAGCHSAGACDGDHDEQRDQRCRAAQGDLEVSQRSHCDAPTRQRAAGHRLASGRPATFPRLPSGGSRAKPEPWLGSSRTTTIHSPSTTPDNKGRGGPGPARPTTLWATSRSPFVIGPTRASRPRQLTSRRGGRRACTTGLCVGHEWR